MDDERLADLERRVTHLEAALRPDDRPDGRPHGRPGDRPGTAPAGGVTAAGPARGVGPAEDTPFWALEGLRARSGEAGAVLVTGSTPLPTGGRAEWQEAHPATDVLDDEWEPTAPVLAALGHPVRLRLLRAVLHGTTTAAELTALPGVGTSGQTYHHLRQLVAAGWLQPSVGAARGAHEVPLARVVPLLAVLALCRR